MAAKTQTDTKREERETVIIPHPKNMTGDEETVVAVNGKIYQIKYDEPVSVPRNVAEVIRQSRSLQAKIDDMVGGALLRPGKRAIAEL